MISSECSFIGYNYLERLHIPLMPTSTVHLKAVSMGHNMLTINSAWSLDAIFQFFKN